jgi:hypothetical protein
MYKIKQNIVFMVVINTPPTLLKISQWLLHFN